MMAGGGWWWSTMAVRMVDRERMGMVRRDKKIIIIIRNEIK